MSSPAGHKALLTISYQYHVYRGSLAQLVEQRPEEPCVPSSSLGGATKRELQIRKSSRIYFLELFLLLASVILVRVWQGGIFEVVQELYDKIC